MAVSVKRILKMLNDLLLKKVVLIIHNVLHDNIKMGIEKVLTKIK